MSSCGLPDPAAQLQGETEPPEEKPPASWQRQVGQGTLVVGGVVVASCLLVVKMRKLCTRIVMPKQAKHLSPQMDEVALAADAQLQHYGEKISQLQDEVTTLRRESKKLHNFVHAAAGRQANLNGAFFEHSTEHALYKIIPNLYKSEKVKKIFRNIEGYLSSPYGKNKNFEIDAIVITAERVFAIETKVTLTRKAVDHFVTLLKKFPRLKFTNDEINVAVQNKSVHGGFSYQFDSKLNLDAASTARSASDYAREHNLLTIPSLTDYKSKPQWMNKLRDFQRQQR